TVGGTTHPYGLWLTPTLLAECAGVPVVWNAVGALDSVARTHDVLVEAALGGVDYLAVRDLESARVVRALPGGAAPVVVPDTIYGIGALLDDGVREMARKTLASLGVTGPYVVVQPSQALARYREGVDAVVVAARAHGLSVLELECGPCHHDRVGRLSLTPPTTHVEPWPEPLVSAAILSEAEAVVASSLHAGIIATAFGVPLHRPRALVGSKHEPLDSLPGVTSLPHDGDHAQAVVRFGRVRPGVEVTSHLTALQHHWDEVARHCVGRGTRGPRAGVAELVEHMPTMLAARDLQAREQLHALARAHEAERHRSHAEVAELLARLDVERATSDTLRAVLARRSVRGALGVADAWGAMRRGRRVPGDPARGGPTRSS
ncbi:MAG TPA: polysaccharide pyruvyl transferase family protein, partial [Acidimicrobiales bacterium]|nr:polysaccharide pyruvyl transferase family protein [Acidimicrobiales bacterium]